MNNSCIFEVTLSRNFSAIILEQIHVACSGLDLYSWINLEFIVVVLGIFYPDCVCAVSSNFSMFYRKYINMIHFQIQVLICTEHKPNLLIEHFWQICL